MTTWSFQQIQDIWNRNGGDNGNACKMAAIAEAESSGNDQARSPTNDWGLWQINLAAHPQYSTGCLLNPDCNARAAIAISNNGADVGAWCTAWANPNADCGRFSLANPQLGSAAYPFFNNCTGGGGATPAPTDCSTNIVPISCTSGVFRSGSQGQCVVVIQQALNCVIRVGISQDGVFGPATDNAVRQYQSSHSLTVDGVVGPNTWQALVNSLARGEGAPIGGPGPGGTGGCEGQLLRVGATGPCVSTLQAGLNQLIGCGLSVDGQFGPATDGCVRRFQGSCNLGQDGVVGPQTWGCFDQRLGAAGGSVSPGGGGGTPTGGTGGAPGSLVLHGIELPPPVGDVNQFIAPGTPWSGQTVAVAVSGLRDGFQRGIAREIINALNYAMRGR